MDELAFGYLQGVFQINCNLVWQDALVLLSVAIPEVVLEYQISLDMQSSLKIPLTYSTTSATNSTT